MKDKKISTGRFTLTGDEIFVGSILSGSGNNMKVFQFGFDEHDNEIFHVLVHSLETNANDTGVGLDFFLKNCKLRGIVLEVL